MFIRGDNDTDECGLFCAPFPKPHPSQKLESLRAASNEAGQISIGKALKQCMDLPETSSIGYLTHADAKRLDKKAKDRYVL